MQRENTKNSIKLLLNVDYWYCTVRCAQLLVFHDILDSNNNLKVVSVKRLAFGKGELLEGHAWSSDDEVFAVAGCKIYLFQVSFVINS